MDTQTTAANIRSWMSLNRITNVMVARKHLPRRITVQAVSYAINGKRTSAPVYKTIARLCHIRVADLLAGPQKAAQKTTDVL